MADETHETPPLSDAGLEEIRNSLIETREAMDEWYTSHPNPQWRREYPFDYDSVVVNTYTYISMPALLAEVDRLRAREAAMRDVLQEVVTVDERGTYIHTYDDGYYADCPYCGATSREPGHRPDCLITKARALLASS